MAYKTLFFFQAEDGIRDIGVTGVQTCALPIYNFLKLMLHAAISRATCLKTPFRNEVAPTIASKVTRPNGFSLKLKIRN